FSRQAEELARAGPTGADEEHVAVGDRQRLAELGLVLPVAPFAVPALLAAARVVAPQAVRAVQHQIDTPAGRRHQPRRAEAAALVARRAPDHRSGLLVQRHQGLRGRLLRRHAAGQRPGAVVVAVLDHQPLEQERRRGGAPAGLAGEDAEGVLPELVAVHVVAEQAGRAEEGVDTLAVGDARRRRIAVPAVRLAVVGVLRRRLLPQDLAVAGPHT